MSYDCPLKVPTKAWTEKLVSQLGPMAIALMSTGGMKRMEVLFHVPGAPQTVTSPSGIQPARLMQLYCGTGLPTAEQSDLPKSPKVSGVVEYSGPSRALVS